MVSGWVGFPIPSTSAAWDGSRANRSSADPPNPAVSTKYPTTARFIPSPGSHGRSEVRIAYVLAEQDLRRAVELLREALTRYKAEGRRQRAEVLR